MLLDCRPSHISSFDGTRLAVYETGRPDGMPIFLVNGLGGNLGTWKYIIDYFESRCRFVSFDYRGMYHSAPPPSGDFSMDAHTRDAITVMDYFGLNDPVVFGWSMGVQVCLELVRAAPERVAALVLANGAYGKPLDRGGMAWMKPVGLATMGLLALAAPYLRPFSRPVTLTTLPVKAAKLTGYVSSRLNEKAFLALAKDFMNLDFASYNECVKTLLDHDAENVLETIDVPTLIVSGGRDLFTPAHLAAQMARRIRDADLLHVKDASHYCAVEYPDLINLRMEKFLIDRVGL